jgi:hypothetical protein
VYIDTFYWSNNGYMSPGNGLTRKLEEIITTLFKLSFGEIQWKQ